MIEAMIEDGTEITIKEKEDFFTRWHWVVASGLGYLSGGLVWAVAAQALAADATLAPVPTAVLSPMTSIRARAPSGAR